MMRNHYVEVTNTDFLAIFYFGAVALSAAYAVTYMMYVVYVVMRTNFLYGFYRSDLLPGPFIDDRYGYPWGMLVLNNARVLLLPALLWVFQNLRIKMKSAIVYTFFGLMCVLDFLLVLLWVITTCFFCNNGVFRNGLCDTNNLTAYCGVWSMDQPDLCSPGSNIPSLQQCDLKPNQVHYDYLWFLLAFFVLDIVIALYLYVVRIFGPPILFAQDYGYGDKYYDDTEEYKYGGDDGGGGGDGDDSVVDEDKASNTDNTMDGPNDNVNAQSLEPKDKGVIAANLIDALNQPAPLTANEFVEYLGTSRMRNNTVILDTETNRQ